MTVTPEQPSYYLRNIDPELWAAVKQRATNEGRAIRFVIITLLRLYQQHGLDAIRKAMNGSVR